MNVQHVPTNQTIWPSAITRRSGPHEVGTFSARLSNANPDVGTLTVQMWYPAVSEEKPRQRLLTWWARLRHPNWAPALRGARLAVGETKFPLITYVPDAAGVHHDNSYTLANLASHGFILAAIQNPFAGAERRVPLTASEAAENSDELCVRSGVRAASALLDALERVHPHGPSGMWAGRLDLKRAGILGYALGGAVAVASTACDARYVVAASLDGGKSEDALVKVPYLLLRHDHTTHGAIPDARAAEAPAARVPNSAELPKRSQASLPTSHILEIEGTRREQFSDQLVRSLLYANEAERTAGSRVRAIIDAYTVAFFKTYMLSTPHPLMRVRHSPYPEVHFIDAATNETHSSWSAAEPTAAQGGTPEKH